MRRHSSISSAYSQRDRHCSVCGTKNLRDMGGYATVDGNKHVRWGILYRGDQLSLVDEDDASDVVVDQLHIRRTYDLRGTSEAANKMYNFPDIERLAFPMLITPVYDRYAAIKPVTTEHVKKLMQELGEFCVEKYAMVAGDVLKDIAMRGVDSDNGILIHCTLGKDRTGFVCSLLLQILGVGDEDIMADYLETNKFISSPSLSDPPGRRRSFALAFDGPEALQAFYSASPEFITVVREAVKAKGGIEAFAVDAMGMTLEQLNKLRDMFLE